MSLTRAQQKALEHIHASALDRKKAGENLLATGLFKNQFVTKISNGLVSPYLGRDRDLLAAWGSSSEIFQNLKLLWHVLVKYG